MFIKILIGTTILVCMVSQSYAGADEHDETVKKDLFAVISLEGHHCGKVVSFQRVSDTEYIATCETGRRYRIYVTSEGQAAVDKH